MMNIDFTSRVAIITGAAQGIGRAIAEAFRDSGAKVHITDIDARVLDVGKEIGAPAHVVDLSNRAAVAQLVDTVVKAEGRLDILALAAGGVCGQADVKLEDITEDSWQAIFKANLESGLWLAQAAAPVMQRAGWGRIVMVSSGAGLRPSLTGLHAYTSAKHAVVGLARQLSVGLAQHGITVNAIAPGLILSNPSSQKQWDGYGADGQKRLLDSLHTRRLGKAEDIANAALFLASEQANWITGQALPVDGGRS
jgi:3-oxoacyl-[acyl-carrier protein] reductase